MIFCRVWQNQEGAGTHTLPDFLDQLTLFQPGGAFFASKLPKYIDLQRRSIFWSKVHTNWKEDVLDYIVSQYSLFIRKYFIKIRMHSFRYYFIPLYIVSRYFMYLVRDSWFFVFVFFPCENWVIRFGFVISHGRSYQQCCCKKTWDFQRIHRYPKFISNLELKKFQC